MTPNPLNAVFTAPQVKAIEKYVANFVATVLQSYEAGAIENKKEAKPGPEPASKQAKKVMLEGEA